MFESYAVLREVSKNNVRSLHVVLLNSLERLHYGNAELVMLPEQTTRAQVVNQVKEHLEKKGISADVILEGEEAIVFPLPDSAGPFIELRRGIEELIGAKILGTY